MKLAEDWSKLGLNTITGFNKIELKSRRKGNAEAIKYYDTFPTLEIKI